MTSRVSLSLLAARVERLRSHYPDRWAIGFHIPSPWTGADTLRANGEEIPLVWCPSPLAFRAELAEREAERRPVVLLTDHPDLGADVLARLAGRRLQTLESWQALRERLGVRGIDPRLRDLRWLPDHLLSLPDDQQLRPATPVLEEEEVWQLLLARLGFPQPRPDLRDLLEWAVSPGGPDALLRLPDEAREAHLRRLADLSGEAVLRLVSAGRGEEAVAAGLVLETLTEEGPGVVRALGRFEATLLGNANLSPAAGQAWAEAAAGLVAQRFRQGGEAAILPWLSQAGRLLTELGAAELGERSGWLPQGFARRLSRFAEALSTWLGAPGPEGLPALETAARDVRGHGLAPARETEGGAVVLLLRLARSLTARRSSARSFAEAAASYAREGSWIDRARTALTEIQPTAPLAGVHERLLDLVTARREEESRRFAELLAAWNETPTATDSVIPLESVLDRVVAPLVEARPVLLLVLDGMSFAVFRALAEDLEARGWEELWPGGVEERLCGVGLLPTVTAVCRASLLSGERRTGDDGVESRSFAAHPGLRRHGLAGRPPILFHKRDLAEGAGVLDEVRDDRRRVVGIILNAVDDRLTKGGQFLPRWKVEEVRHLKEILQAAEAAGRTVVLTADHGHVLERQSELRRHDRAGARYRPAGAAPAGDGEVAVRGPRVLLGEGTGLVLAWSERLRYSNVQDGYHGGASPQEALVPVSVWAPHGPGLPGWVPAPPDVPDWWPDEPVTPAEAPVVSPISRRKPPGPAQASLFAPAPEPAPMPSSAPSSVLEPWLAALFASPAYQEQRERTARLGLTDEKVAEALRVLAERDGRVTLTALAHRLGLSLRRAGQLLAALQSRLNLEGFAVIALDPVSDTVNFDQALLKRQFLSGEGEERGKR